MTGATSPAGTDAAMIAGRAAEMAVGTVTGTETGTVTGIGTAMAAARTDGPAGGMMGAVRALRPVNASMTGTVAGARATVPNAAVMVRAQSAQVRPAQAGAPSRLILAAARAVAGVTGLAGLMAARQL